MVSQVFFRFLSRTAQSVRVSGGVQAFTTRLTTTTRPLVGRTFSSAPVSVSANVEDDLDTALENILGDVFSDKEDVTPPPVIQNGADEIPIQKNGARIAIEVGSGRSRTKVIPECFLRCLTLLFLLLSRNAQSLADQDFKDPAFLSTSNPRWVQAGLDQRVIDILSAKGITHFTPVQGEAFDPVLMGRDVIGRSRTGTGKTLAFGLPGITRLVTLLQEKGVRDAGGRMARGRKTSMLVLCPTRELARQVADEIASVARPLGLFAEVFHGGVSYDPQTRALRQGLDILVGTPGRVIDHLNRGNLDLSECETVVLDEADEMLNMGFAEDVETILDGIGSGNKEKTQCLLFSATTPPWVKTIGKRYQTNVLAIDSTGNEGARVASTVRHLAVQVAPGVDSKRSVLEDIIAVEISKDLDIDSDSEDEGLEALNPIAYAAGKKKLKTNNAMQQKIFGKTIVFTETKRAADELVSGGVFKSLTAQALHGDVGQKQRDATLNAFRAGAFNVLVATDVAARGYVPRKDVARSGGQGSEANPAICLKLQN
jgi:superfamily II DNA/RNA helicase